MSNKYYIIKQAYYGYTDEEYIQTGTTIAGRYDSAEEAEAVAKKLRTKIKKEEDIGSRNPCRVVELEESGLLYCVWNVEKNEPMMDPENLMYGDYPRYSHSRAAAQKMAMDDGLMPVMLEGALEYLTDNPAVLASLIDSERGLKFDGSVLTMTKKIAPTVNELLKKPFFEIKEMTPAEVMQMESTLEQVKVI